MSIQCNVFSLALVLNDFVPLLCVLLSSVDVVLQNVADAVGRCGISPAPPPL